MALMHLNLLAATSFGGQELPYIFGNVTYLSRNNNHFASAVDFTTNVSEFHLNEPNYFANFPRKVYYGKLKFEMDEEKDVRDKSEPKFNLFNSIRTLGPGPPSDKEGRKTEKLHLSVESALHTESQSDLCTVCIKSSKIAGDRKSINDSYTKSNEVLKNHDVMDKMHPHKSSKLKSKKSKWFQYIEDEELDTRWRRISNVILDIINKKYANNNSVTTFDTNNSNFTSADPKLNNTDVLLTVVANFTRDLSAEVKLLRSASPQVEILVTAYTVLMVVSLVTNLQVCYVVVRTKRLHTIINTFLTNLALSDLAMTAFNMPFSVARMVLDDWPFGSVLCCLVPFTQVVSVYVNSFTMAAIALDRYQVIVHPLRPRLEHYPGVILIAAIWIMASVLALPYALFNQVVEVYTYRRLLRCQAQYPAPSFAFRQWLTLGTVLVQYVAPLTLTSAAYIAVVRKVWWGASIVMATHKQNCLRIRANKKTVRMLVMVVIVFAICWLPLNIYHLVVDFSTTIGPTRHSSVAFFLCHWVAMSSVCYNPFIYCWLNDHFRTGTKMFLVSLARQLIKLLCCTPNTQGSVETLEMKTNSRLGRGNRFQRTIDISGNAGAVSSSSCTSYTVKTWTTSIDNEENGAQLHKLSNILPAIKDLSQTQVIKQLSSTNHENPINKPSQNCRTSASIISKNFDSFLQRRSSALATANNKSIILNPDNCKISHPHYSNRNGYPFCKRNGKPLPKDNSYVWVLLERDLKGRVRCQSPFVSRKRDRLSGTLTPLTIVSEQVPRYSHGRRIITSLHFGENNVVSNNASESIFE